MPAHVRGVDLPQGVYWNRDRRHWYTIDAGKRIKLGDARATLAEITTRLTDVRGVARDTLDWLMAEFEQSVEFKRLGSGSQKNYRRHRAAISKFRTRAGLLGTLPAARLDTTLFQGIVDKLDQAGTPTKANHWLRYLRRVYSFGCRRTKAIRTNPCRGVQQARERSQERKAPPMPSPAVHAAVLAYARAGADLAPHAKGAVPGYVWMLMELMYLCRLRSIEAATLTDAHALREGVRTNRRKGSRDNIVAWTPRLQTAWNAAIERRRKVWEKHRTAIPLAADKRPLLVNESGDALTDTGIQDAWRSMMKRAIVAGAVVASDRFTSHGLKHRGVTDTPGNRHDKQHASGHRNEKMMDVYDHELPVVPTSERPNAR